MARIFDQSNFTVDQNRTIHDTSLNILKVHVSAPLTQLMVKHARNIAVIEMSSVGQLSVRF